MFTTRELPTIEASRPVYVADTEESFNLGQLIVSIASAFTHAPQEGAKNALYLAQAVETCLMTDYKTITGEDIAAVTHGVLKRFDELAAVQYAARHHLIKTSRRRGRPLLRER